MNAEIVKQLKSRRYTELSFPPYRFIPGQHPHPTANPEGHSYHPPDEPEPPAPFHPAEDWRKSSEYLFGIDLYNHGYWWEAHESWEALWQLTDKSGVQGKFLQGLIQTGAAHLKFLLNHPRGFDRLKNSSRAYLEFVVKQTNAPIFMGLNVPSFVQAIDAYYKDRPLGSDHLPDEYPYLVMDNF